MHQPAGFNYPHITEFWRVLVGAIVTQIAKYIIAKLAYPYCYKVAKGKDEELKVKYANKAAEYVFQTVQYTICTYWGYQELKDTDYLPWFMGGTTDIETAFLSTMKNAPFDDYPRGLYEWFLYSSGIYFGELIKHVLLDKRGNDFVEFLMHHLATCFLVFGSALGGKTAIGSIISWLHMASDVTASMSKVVASTHFETLTAIFFAGIFMPQWFFWRLVCLPLWIYPLFFH